MSPHSEAGFPKTVTSPEGERFRSLGRARPVRVEIPSQVSTETADDQLAIKEGEIFVCSGHDGDIAPGSALGAGVYKQDTRFLSELCVRLGGVPLVLSSCSSERMFEAVIDLSSPDLWREDALAVPGPSLHLRRTRSIYERMFESLELTNRGETSAATQLEVSVAADFADVFEIRGVHQRAARGHRLEPKADGDTLRFGYLGEDDVFRETTVSFSPPPEHVDIAEDPVIATWSVELPPGATSGVTITVDPSIGGIRAEPRGRDDSRRRAREGDDLWMRDSTTIETDDPLVDRVIARSLRDLRALSTPVNGETFVAAGIPWFVAAFGRDSLLATYMTMMVNPRPARDTLMFLAARQAETDDPFRDAEPGKILHELRAGELANSGQIPHTPYYGSVDATVLFVMLAAEYLRWTGDVDTVRRLVPHLDRAAQWIDRYGDVDGDGFVEYRRRSPRGLGVQGWKDSSNSTMYADGAPVHGPVALCEVQGYVYAAKERLADIYEVFRRTDDADRLRREAASLKHRFNDVYWMPDEDTYALALDGSKRLAPSVASNAGHCLWTGIADNAKAPALAARLMADDMFSGWGVRTLSSDSPAYDPMSYHNGSVWPHDNALIAAGLKRYGSHDAADRIATALFEAAISTVDARLPELFCGFGREEGSSFVAYPVACRPQAWSAATPFMLLQSALGLSPDGATESVTLDEPKLPDFLARLDIRALRVGSRRLTLSFHRDGDSTRASISNQA